VVSYLNFCLTRSYFASNLILLDTELTLYSLFTADFSQLGSWRFVKTRNFSDLSRVSVAEVQQFLQHNSDLANLSECSANPFPYLF
jgi:hypothetical protein